MFRLISKEFNFVRKFATDALPTPEKNPSILYAGVSYFHSQPYLIIRNLFTIMFIMAD
jgi:hypothetical protein